MYFSMFSVVFGHYPLNIMSFKTDIQEQPCESPKKHLSTVIHSFTPATDSSALDVAAKIHK